MVKITVYADGISIHERFFIFLLLLFKNQFIRVARVPI